MLHWFYCLPLETVMMFIICLICLCGMFNYFINRLNRKLHLIACVVLLLISIFLILLATVYKRPDNVQGIIIQPFQSFRAAKEQPEMYRTMLMNVVLFLPYGLAMTMLLSNAYSTLSILASVCMSTAFISIIIEVLQYFFHAGLSQTDDVLCNIFGSALGTGCIFINRKLYKSVLNNYSFK